MLPLRRLTFRALKSNSKCFSSTPVSSRVPSEEKKFTLPALPYEYNALEPIICSQIMEIHHSKHHATYINNLNVATEQLEKAIKCNDIGTMMKAQSAIIFNGGGHLNHSIFWKTLSPCSSKPSAELEQAINDRFGSIDGLKKELATLSIGVQGSGWGWLGYNPASKKLDIAACKNQDPLQATTGLIPLFGIDVWEHAYYLQYRNVRADYVNAIMELANWEEISKMFKAAGC